MTLLVLSTLRKWELHNKLNCLTFHIFRFTVVLYEAHHHCIISELQDMIVAESGSAVKGEQAEEL